jgi:hypothetical protein
MFVRAGVALGVLVVGPAMGADMPVKAPVYEAAPSAVASGNWYFWLDDMYERVRLPSYALGIHNIAFPAPFVDRGPTQSFDPSLNGGAVRGALGYVMPGSGVRLELGGSYVTGTGSSSQTTTTPYSAEVVLLNGTLPALSSFVCAGKLTCSTTGTLSTSYDAWQVNGKVAADAKYGKVLVTPFAALFGGNTRNNQSLAQSFTQSFVGGAIADTGTYSANTSLHWTDFGGRAGLDFTIPLTGPLTLGFGGWVGGATRNVSLAGSDAANSAPLPLFHDPTSVSAGDTKGVFLANAEVGLAYAFSSTLILRGFGGLNYDDSVPGIASPSFTGQVTGPTSTTAARITYTPETSYYAGGGVLWRF